MEAREGIKKITSLKSQKRSLQHQEEMLDRGNAFLKEGKGAESQKSFKEVLKENPSQADALAGLGKAYAMQGEDADAEKLYHASLEKDPKNSSALESLVSLNLKHKNYKEANYYLDELVKFYPDVDYYRQLQEKVNHHELNEHLATVKKEENDSINSSASIFRTLGNSYLQQKRYSRAIVALQQALYLEPDHAKTQLALAEAYFQRASLQDAQEGELAYQFSFPWITHAINDDLFISRSFFAQAFDNDRSLSQALVGLGRVALALCQYSLAESYFLEAIVHDPQDTFAWDRLAAVKIKQRKFVQARSIYEDLLSIDSSDPDMWDNYYAMRHKTFPSFSLFGFYSQEDERNPQVYDVARLKNYGAAVKASYPICEGLKLSGFVLDQYIILRNQLNFSTIYSVGIQRAQAAVTFDPCAKWTVTASLGFSYWQKYQRQNFITKRGLYVEPSLLAEYHCCRHTLIISALSFSEIVARNFKTNHAKLIETRALGMLYEYDLGKRRSVGIEISNGWYNDRVHNQRQFISPWIQISPLTDWKNFAFRYQFEYANFVHPIPDYYTYHNRTTHWVKFDCTNSWHRDKVQGRLGYWHGWQRSFEQGQVLTVVPTFNFHYVHREIDYIFSELLVEASPCLSSTLTGSYYHDTLHYSAWSIKWEAKWNF